MRTRSVPTLALLLGLASCAAAGGRQEYARNYDRDDEPAAGLALHGRQLNFGAGLRTFDESFGELDDQVALTLDYCEPMGVDWLRLEGGLHFSYDEGDDTRPGGEEIRLKGQTLELSAGVNHSFLLGRLRPYVGVGGSLLFLNLRGYDDERDALFDDDDATVGGYAKGGILFQVSRTSHVGVEFRHFTGGDVSFDGTDVEADYDQILFVFGTSIDPDEY